MRPPQWLNDEAVNFYMATLNDRDTRDRAGPGRFPRCHFFNTFVYAKLKQAGYNGVTRWSLPMRLVYTDFDSKSRVESFHSLLVRSLLVDWSMVVVYHLLNWGH